MFHFIRKSGNLRQGKIYYCIFWSDPQTCHSSNFHRNAPIPFKYSLELRDAGPGLETPGPDLFKDIGCIQFTKDLYFLILNALVHSEVLEPCLLGMGRRRPLRVNLT